MEKKNTVLLTVIAVATLLVAVVGATFAYFTATSTSTGTSGKVDVTTADVAGATLTIGSAEGKSYLKYPGGVGYSGVTLKATKADTDNSTNNYNLSYQLKLTYTNSTDTDLNYKVYKVASITDPVCKEHEDSTSVPGQTLYYYTAAGAADSATPNDCTITGLDSAEVVANGTLTKGTATATDVTLAKDGTNVTFNSKTNEAVETYYLVVEYPNAGTDESTGNMGKTISAQITGTVAAPVQTVVAAGAGD